MGSYLQGICYQDRHAEYPRAAYQRRTVRYTFRCAVVRPAQLFGQMARAFQEQQENNNALANTVTPDSARATAELKWVKKYGEGWMRPVNLPIIVNNHVYIARNDDIFCLSKDSGEAVVSGKLAASLGGHGTNSMVYAEGMVFVQLDNGHIQALRADTLESLWVTESIGDADHLLP